MHFRRWKVPPKNGKEPATLAKLLVAQCSMAYQDMFSLVKDKLLHFMSLTAKKKAQSMVGILGTVFITFGELL